MIVCLKSERDFDDMNLSVCIITKNECENLKKCLQALKPYDLEIVVVDTGSTDGTLKMVREYTDAVFEFSWCDDFAKAKNFAISKAKNDRVLVLDSDEYVTAFDVSGLEHQLIWYPEWIGRIKRCNQIKYGAETRIGTEYINRLFDRRLFHYKGRVHEQLVWISGAYAGTGEGICTYETGICIDHSGYLLSGDQKNEKIKRNIVLLQHMLREQGDDPYILYQLGKSYYMGAQYVDACAYFEKALTFDLDEHLEYVIDMVETYGYALLNAGRAADALGYEGLCDAFGKTSDFRFLMGLIYMNNELFSQAVESFMRAVELGNAKMMGTDSYLAYYNAGVIMECLDHTSEAMEFYGKAGGYAQAEARLDCLRRGIR